MGVCFRQFQMLSKFPFVKFIKCMDTSIPERGESFEFENIKNINSRRV